MSHNCFISFKKEDIVYKDELIKILKEENVIEKSLDKTIDSEDGDYIMQKIREDYLKDSTVTLFLIGEHSSENEGYDEKGRAHNYFIQRELQASLYNGVSNTRNGIVGIVIPKMYNKIFLGSYTCNKCGLSHRTVAIDDYSVIREFSVNYYIKPHEGCCWHEDERYCVLVKWDDFKIEPEKYINMAFEKRDSSISEKIKIRNLR